jgi:hypothetical protein
MLSAVVNVTFGLRVAKSSVPVKAPMLMVARLHELDADGQLAVDVPQTVTVPPPLEPSNVAISPAFFGMPPVAAHVVALPPDDDDHEAVLELSALPVPPTQKQVAACAGMNESARSARARR